MLEDHNFLGEEQAEGQISAVNMFAAAKNLGEGGGGMGDLLTRLRAREKARHGLQVSRTQSRESVTTVTRRFVYCCGVPGPAQPLETEEWAQVKTAPFMRNVSPQA